jgi:hypothetical protein
VKTSRPGDPALGHRARALLYRRTTPNGTALEAMWLTDWPSGAGPEPSAVRRAKSRWAVEDERFNVAKTLHQMEYLCPHHAKTVVAN